MASTRPTHERKNTDAEIAYAPQLASNVNVNEDSRSQKSGFSSEKEAAAREDGLSAIGQTESFDTEHARNQQIGVNRIEALFRVYQDNRVAIWCLYLSLAGVVCAFSLDSNTTSSYLPFATSSYGKHALISAIGTADLIIPSVSKPFISKIADISSRHLALAFVLVLYVLGYILIAATKTVEGLSVGRVFASVGEAGCDQVVDIVVADLTPLQWRGFLQAMTSSPNIPLAFVGGKIAGSIIDGGNNLWRWGYGMFCIILPVFIIPAILVLYFADRRAQKIGALSFAASPYEKRMVEEKGSAEEKPSWFQLLKYYSIEMDLFGLILLAFGCSLFFLPFNLAAKAKGAYKNPSMIAMWVVGGLIIIGFSFFEKFIAPKPVINRRIFQNRAFLLAMTIDVFYFMSGFIRSTYFSSYLWVIKLDWSADDLAYFNNISNVALSLFGLFAGLWLRYTHRYKALQLSGLIIRSLGMGLSLYARKDNATDAALVCTQILIYVGGAFSVVGSRVASQASVPHADLAMVIAMLALFTKLGGAVGTTVAGGIWTNTMQENMRKHLPASVTDAQITKLFGSIRDARASTPEIRAGVVAAYDETMFPMFLLAFLLTLPPIVCGFFMPNYYLGNTQNAVDGTTVSGKKTVDSRVENDNTRAPEDQNIIADAPSQKRFGFF